MAPQILESCVKKLQAKGKTKSSAYAICTQSLQDAGTLKHGTQELTEKGKGRQAIRNALTKK